MQDANIQQTHIQNLLIRVKIFFTLRFSLFHRLIMYQR